MHFALRRFFTLFILTLEKISAILNVYIYVFWRVVLKLIVFDGNSILNRAYYGIRPLSTKEGIPTNALYGFINIIRKNVNMLGEEPIYGAVAFDMRHPTFRHKKYDGYKATRKGMPEDLAVQLPYAKEAATLLGFKVIEKEGFEADDILGTLSAMGEEAGLECFVVTGDRDSLQLVSEKTTVFLAATNETKIFTPESFMEAYGFEPEYLVDAKAIMGDSSDNIPGVAGIGEKGAYNLIKEYKTLENVFANADKCSKGIQKKLSEGKESAEMSYFLAKIIRDVPIGNIEDFRIPEKDNGKLREFFLKMEFRAMAEKLDVEPEKTEIPVFSEKVSELESLGKEIYLVEKDGFIYVYDGEKGVKAENSVLEKLKDKTITVWSKKELAHSLSSYNSEQNGDDLSLLAYVAGSNQGTLNCAKNAAEVYLEISVPDVPEAIVSVFPKLKEKLWQIIEEREQKELYNMELKLSSILFDMEKRGFKVDREGLVSFSEFLQSRIIEAESKVFQYAGEEFNVNSSKQLGVILFEKLNLPHGKKTKTGYSTDAEVLEKLIPYHPIINEILIYRQLSKLKSTYAEGLLKVISDDGRIHTTFRQTLTQTGRLSSAEPNLQNIPVRTELGRVFRKFFVAEEGNVLIDADYSQIELRILAHISEDETLISAFRNGEDIHTITASGVFGIPAEAVNSELRKRAKAINFGIIYGISDFALSNDIGVSVKEARAYINDYFATYPKISEYLEKTVKEAYEKGYVTTLFGRRRYIPELSAPKKTIKAFGERIARNSPIQGTAADIIKKAMIDVSEEFKKENMKSRIILQIHEELIVESPENEKDKAAKILQKGMEKAYSLSVPLIAEAVFGQTWFEAHS